MVTEKEIYHRSELLLGNETMELIAQKRVILFGVGGVGSWCAEALVRSGIKHLTIVDFDTVNVTNINRQLMATTKTIDQIKVDALKERLLTINPYAEITALHKVFTQRSSSDKRFNRKGQLERPLPDPQGQLEVRKARTYSRFRTALSFSESQMNAARFPCGVFFDTIYAWQKVYAD